MQSRIWNVTVFSRLLSEFLVTPQDQFVAGALLSPGEVCPDFPSLAHARPTRSPEPCPSALVLTVALQGDSCPPRTLPGERVPGTQVRPCLSGPRTVADSHSCKVCRGHEY